MNTSPNDLYKEKIIATKKKLRQDIPDLTNRLQKITSRMTRQVDEIKTNIAKQASTIPEISFKNLQKCDDAFKDLVRKRGCIIIRGVFDRALILDWNAQIDNYLHHNHYLEKSETKRGLDQYFSNLASSKPQIYAVYWSKPQIYARQSIALAQARSWLNHLWDNQQDHLAVFNPALECSYADRIRQRQPGDATLGLSPHIDGGGIERWIDEGYRNVYREVFYGDVTAYNPFSAAYRTSTQEIPSPAVCRMFRTFQGWTALSAQGPGEGTLNLAPIADAMSWILLRALQDDIDENDLCGVQAGRAMMMSAQYHDLLLESYMPIPHVEEGDTVWWHPDIIHGVEDRHEGDHYSNVMYIGAAPDCPKNRKFLEIQKPTFEQGRSSPDFAPEDYEVDFNNRATLDDLSDLGRQQMGY